jgi:hypothetical protein
MIVPSAALVHAIVFACLMSLFPWKLISKHDFPDLDTYIDYFETGAYEYLDDLEGFSYIMSEPLWRQIIYQLSDMLGSVPFTFQIISFIIWSILAYVLIKYSPKYSFLLLSPLLLDLVISQVRSGLMISLFYVWLLNGSLILFIILFAFAFFIHGAAILIFGYYALSYLMSWISKRNQVLSKLLTVGVSILMPLGFAVSHRGILASFGDRRSEMEPGFPGGSFVLGILVYYLIMLININQTIRRPISIFTFLVCGSFLVLAMYEINLLRFIALIFPLLFLCALYLPPKARVICMLNLFGMTFYHLLLWLGPV